MKTIAVIFVSIVFVIIAVVICLPEKLSLGTFLVLALTLIVLVLYAYDTNSIAKVSRERWMKDGILGTTFSMEVVPEGILGRTLFRIHNTSTLIIRAKVNCNFKLYGKPINSYPIFDGTNTWIVFPLQTSQGWFEIESLLNQNKININSLKQERTKENCENQLTIDLVVKFWDELSNHRELPKRHYHFDFEDWIWIPKLTEATN